MPYQNITGISNAYVGGIEASIEAAAHSLQSYLRVCREENTEPDMLDLSVRLGQLSENIVEQGLPVFTAVASAVGVGYAFAVWEMDLKAREAKESPGDE